MLAGNWLAGVAVGAAVLALGGCATVNRYSGQMATFNTEAERTQDQALMLNVLRAANYRPLSFIEMQTVTGTVTPSASIGLSAPLAQNGGATATTLSPTFGLTGGPTISAAYIDTQDFYRGVLTPLPMSTIDLLIQRRIPSTVLFSLLFSRIIVKQIPNSEVDKGSIAEAEVFTAVNDPASAHDHEGAYQALVEALLNEGLTTGPGKAGATDFGPPLTDEDLSSSEEIARIAAAGLKVQPISPCDLDDQDAASLARRTGADFTGLKAKIKADCEVIDRTGKRPNLPKAPVDAAKKSITAAIAEAKAPLIYELVKADAKADPRFCIAAPRSADGATEVPSGACQTDAIESQSAGSDGKFRVRLTSREKNGDNDTRLCEALNQTARSGGPLDCSDPAWLANGLEVDLEPRSTYSIIYYLGEVVRRGLRGGPPLLIKVGDIMTAIPAEPCRQAGQTLAAGSNTYTCEPLFDLRPARSAGRAYLTVAYDGQAYAVPDGGGSKTNEVLDILNELIALNHSAKDSPASSLITVVGSH
jgi:hypothetical protein